MWKRVHLAIVDGPDSGHVIDLGAAGRGVRAGLEVRIGSDILADVRIRDAHLPPRHLRVRAGTNRWGIRGVWVDGGDAGGARHVRVGGRYRAGATTFEARTDTTRRARRRDAGFLLPLVGAAGLAAMWALPGAGPVPILAAAAAGVALTARSRRPPLPDPARLARAGLTTAAVGGGRTGGRGGETGGLLSRLRPGSADGTVRVAASAEGMAGAEVRIEVGAGTGAGAGRGVGAGVGAGDGAGA